MKCIFLVLTFLITTLLFAQKKVISLQIDGSINPASAAFIRSGIEKAEKENAACLIIHLNTPGGLLKSTRVIVSDILESPLPVVVYVSPVAPTLVLQEFLSHSRPYCGHGPRNKHRCGTSC